MDWFRAMDSTDEFGAAVFQPLDASSKPDTLAAHLAEAGLRDWRDAIMATGGQGQPVRLEPRLGWLMGQAAIEIAASIEQPDRFGVVENLQMLSGVSDASLAAAICSRVEDTSEEPILLACLRTHLQALWNSRFNDRLRLQAEASAAQPLRSRDLWPRYDGMPVGDGWAHLVAATLWPERYMEMLASFPTPFQYGFGDRLSPLGLDVIASLVEASPSVFSEDGIALGPVVVFALLDVVETRFASIDVQHIAAAEIGIDTVIDRILSRRDGDWIGRAWLQQIIWQEAPRRAGRAQADVSAQRTLRDTLLVRLSARTAPLGEAAFPWIRQEEPLWRVYRILSAASILEAHGDATGAAEILAEAVKQGLVSATGRSAVLTTSSPEATIVARILAGLPDMEKWFECLWHDTYELREHLSYPSHRNLDNPAYPALAWGLIGLNSSQAASVDTARFWRRISTAVFETQRIDPNANLFNGVMPVIARATAQIGAALARLGILPVDDLAAFLADQLEPTLEHAQVWHIVRAEASDVTALDTGRLIGASLLRQALEIGLAQRAPASGGVLDQAARNDLINFSSRL
jgi:hypothetical protein